MWAAASGNCDVVTELISLGADVDIQNNVSYFLYVTVKMVQDPPKCLCTLLPHTLLMAYFPYGILVSGLGKHIE